MNYFQTRLAALNLTPDEIKLKVWDDLGGNRFVPLLSEDKEGNICIPYLSLFGGLQTYAPKDRKKGKNGEFNASQIITKDYVVKRLKDPRGDMKYSNPHKEELRIYHTPGIVRKFAEKEEIETLYLIEGQFKAISGWKNLGIDIVGITGKWGWKIKRRRKFHQDILTLIESCKVKRLVLILDADSRLLKPEKVEKGEDLSERFFDFFNTVSQFGEIASELKCKAYFAQVHEDSPHKGLDDLIQASPEESYKGIRDALEPTTWDNKHFQGLDLSEATKNQVRGFFRIQSVSVFFDRYADLIGDQAFIWNGGRYQYDDQKGTVRELEHPESGLYIRVGTTYFKSVWRPTQLGDEIHALEPWLKSEIKEDYKHIPGFMGQIKRYDTGCNIPCNIPQEFQQTFKSEKGHGQAYNWYHPPHIHPEEGGWEDIEMYLKHVFEGTTLESGEDQYIMALDYLSLLFKRPWQKLPILVLASKTQETGKSTFLNLLSNIYGNNMVTIGNDDITDPYNAHWASRLIVGIQEGLIERKRIAEKIKDITDSRTIAIHAKFANKDRIDCHVHWIITTNNVFNFMPLSPEDRRVWLVSVPKIKKKDPELEDRMVKQIPGFLHFLMNREIVHPRQSGLWFPPSLYDTPILREAKAQSLPSLQKSIIAHVRDYMLEYKSLEAHFTITELRYAMDIQGKDVGYLKKVLTEDMGIAEPIYATTEKAPHVGPNEKKSGRFFSFKAEDFLTPGEIKEMQQ